MARSRFGNSNVSSLLRTSQAAYDKNQVYDDNIAALVYDESAKTQDDFNKYKDYLNGRIDKTADPSKQLSLTKTSISAERTFRSAEIFRQTMSVNYGEIDNPTKYQRMLGLYQDAVANGDYNQAQSIEGQLASLSITIQNERDAAAAKAEAGAKSAAAASTAAQKAGFAKQKTNLDTLQNAYDIAYKTGTQVKNPDGSLAVDPSTGKPVGYITEQNHQQLIGGILKQKERATVDEIKTMGDETGSLTKDLGDIQSNPTFLSYNSPQSQQDQALRQSGTAAERQSDGTVKYVKLGEAGKVMTGKDANGMPLFATTFDTGKTSDGKFITSSRLANDVNSPIVNRLEHLNPGELDASGNPITQKGQKDASGLDYYLSSKTGDKFHTFDTGDGRTGKGLAVPVPGGSIDYQKNKGIAPTPTGAGDVLGIPNTQGWLYNVANPDPSTVGGKVIDEVKKAKGLGSHLLRAGANVIPGPAGQIISGLLTRNDQVTKQKAVVAAQQAAAAKAVSDAAIQKQMLDSAAHANAIRAAAQVKTPSVMYSAPVQTPAQKVATVAAAGGGTPAAVAKGIGAAVGYDKIIGKLGW